MLARLRRSSLTTGAVKIDLERFTFAPGDSFGVEVVVWQSERCAMYEWKSQKSSTDEPRVMPSANYVLTRSMSDGIWLFKKSLSIMDKMSK